MRISPEKAVLTRRVGSGWLRWGREGRERGGKLLLLFNYVVVVLGQLNYVVVVKLIKLLLLERVTYIIGTMGHELQDW